MPPLGPSGALPRARDKRPAHDCTLAQRGTPRRYAVMMESEAHNVAERVADEGSSCAQESKPEGLMTSGRVGEYGERCTAPDPSLRYLPGASWDAGGAPGASDGRRLCLASAHAEDAEARASSLARQQQIVNLAAADDIDPRATTSRVFALLALCALTKSAVDTAQRGRRIGGPGWPVVGPWLAQPGSNQAHRWRWPNQAQPGPPTPL